MALTPEQWFQKLKGLVPSWFFSRNQHQEAHFRTTAKILSDIQAEGEATQQQTFIAQASGGVVDLHGDERSIVRIELPDDEMEEDGEYSFRVRNIINQSDVHNIKRIVDGLLLVGECVIIESGDANGAYLNRGLFLNRGQFLLNEFPYNVFTILVDKQVHPPYMFLDRGHFLNREDFIGSNEVPEGLYSSIQEAVDTVKALGVLYKIIERAA
jgi:hypothetical protein